MLILALDTTTAAGSLALARDADLLDARTGLDERTHGERLPMEITAMLERHDASLAEVDRFVVAAGPGSFTGLRVGIATIQGLALSLGRPVVAISVLDALVEIARNPATGEASPPEAILAWMDGKRGEVFAALYVPGDGASGWRTHLGPTAAAPASLLDDWADDLDHLGLVVGDAVAPTRPLLEERLPAGVHLLDTLPAVAGAMALMAARPPWSDEARGPHAIRPVYVRRPDAELARDRRQRGA